MHVKHALGLAPLGGMDFADDWPQRKARTVGVRFMRVTKTSVMQYAIVHQQECRLCVWGAATARAMAGQGVHSSPAGLCWGGGGAALWCFDYYRI